MLKKSSLLSIFLLAGISVFAQSTDSIEVVKAAWNTKKIAKKVKLLTHSFNSKNLFNSNQNISILEVDNTGKNAIFALSAEAKELVKTSDFGIKENAIAAINGNFFDMKNGGSVDFVKVNNNIINTTRLEKNDKRAFHQKAGVVIDKGILNVVKWDETADWESKLTEADVLLNGPLLIFNHVDEKIDSSAFNKNRHPRTCVGVKANGQVILVTVDGRNANGEGMTLFELTKFMRWMGCKDVINFDGGGSTALWVNGQGQNGVINYPSDNKQWDHDGQRKVANVLLVKKK